MIRWLSFECRKVLGLYVYTTWLVKNLAPLFHEIRSKTNINQDSRACVRFPALRPAACIHFMFWLVLWIFYVLCDWLGVLLWFYGTRLINALISWLNVEKFFLSSSSYNLTDFYVPSFDEPDFVCAMKGIPGMQSCNSESIPPLKDHISGRTCTLSYEGFLKETERSNNSNACVNWNQYYSQCQKDGDNPSWGAIGFDNIFIAWVAIFQVK